MKFPGGSRSANDEAGPVMRKDGQEMEELRVMRIGLAASDCRDEGTHEIISLKGPEPQGRRLKCCRPCCGAINEANRKV